MQAEERVVVGRVDDRQARGIKKRRAPAGKRLSPPPASTATRLLTSEIALGGCPLYGNRKVFAGHTPATPGDRFLHQCAAEVIAADRERELGKRRA
jgi:hypothetical protein